MSLGTSRAPRKTWSPPIAARMAHRLLVAFLYRSHDESYAAIREALAPVERLGEISDDVLVLVDRWSNSLVIPRPSPRSSLTAYRPSLNEMGRDSASPPDAALTITVESTAPAAGLPHPLQ